MNFSLKLKMCYFCRGVVGDCAVCKKEILDFGAIEFMVARWWTKTNLHSPRYQEFKEKVLEMWSCLEYDEYLWDISASVSK